VSALIVAAAAYLVVGVATSALAGAAASVPMRTAWRLAAWVLCLAVFLGHFAHERRRAAGGTLRTALRCGSAVALGALALAAAGPVRSHWGAPDQARALLALVLWPTITGVPAFLAALTMAALTGRRSSGSLA